MASGSFFLANAQKKCQLRLLKNPGKLNGPYSEEMIIKSIRLSNKKDSILIKYPDNKVTLLANDVVWGYQGRDCVIYRNIFSGFIKTEKILDSVIIYSRTSIGFRGKLVITYYFSKKFDSPVYRLDNFNIHEQFKNNPVLSDSLEKYNSL
jgi:hypothetical protein